MNKNNLFTLLKIIVNHGNVGQLARRGLSYNDVAELITYSKKEKILVVINDKIELTSKGESLYKELEPVFKNTNKEEWIDKDKKNMIDKIHKDFVFLPSQNELTFLDE